MNTDMCIDTKTAILYVKAGEFDDQAGIECSFRYPADITEEEWEEKVGKYVKENFNKFKETLSFTLNCAKDCFLNDKQEDFPILHKLLIDNGLAKVLKVTQRLKKVPSVSEPVITPEKDIKEKEEAEESEEDFEATYYNPRQRSYIRLLEKCIAQAPDIEVYQFLTGYYSGDGTYTYNATFYKLEDHPTYLLI